MGSLPDVGSLVSKLKVSHAASTTDMERMIATLKQYEARNKELEIENSLLRERISNLTNLEMQSADEDKFLPRHDRRTISESANSKPWKMEHQPTDNLCEYWSCFRPNVADMSGISDINDGWTRPLSIGTMPSPPLWEPLSHKSSSSEGSDPSSTSADSRCNTSCEAAGDRRQQDADDDFDLREIQQAMRESENEIWKTAGSKEKKSIAGLGIPEGLKPVSKSISLPSKAAPEKNIISALPEDYLGKWYAVKSSQTGGGQDGHWKDVPRNERKKTPRVAFYHVFDPRSKRNLYYIVHKKFTINNAVFYEHCGGQRCIVLKDRANMILVRNKNLTHTFCIQNDGRLIEVFKDGNTEYKVLSVKE